MKERTIELKKVKSALAKKFGFKNVRVKKGDGTASHWIEVTIYVSEHNSVEQQMILKDFVENTIRDTGVKLFTFPDDQGGEDHECLLINIRTR